MPILGPSWLSGQKPPEPAYLAVLDVLGYTQLAQNDLRRLISLTSGVQTLANLGAYKGIGTPVAVPRLRLLHYADTILMAAEGDTPADLRSLIDGVRTVLWQAIAEGIGLRGAIHRGDLYISDGMLDFPATFQGRGLVRAHELERAQQWAGVIVDTDSIRSPEEIDLLTDLTDKGILREFEVPWAQAGAKRSEVRQYPAVDWTQIAHLAWPMIEAARDNAYGPIADERARAKWDATKCFFESRPNAP